MKTVLLFRHGKSDWDADFGSDHERPLAQRGRRAASLMGKYLANIAEVPDLVLSSTAKRAHDTVVLAVEAGDWPCPVETRRELYEATPDDVLATIRVQEDALNTVLWAGHEPTFSELTSRLIGGGQVRFPTAAMLRIDLEVDRWTEVGWGSGVLTWFVTPRLLKRAVV